MPLVGPIPEGKSFFCPHCGALYSVTDSQFPKESGAAKCVVYSHTSRPQAYSVARSLLGCTCCCCCCWITGLESLVIGIGGSFCSSANRVQTRAISIRRERACSEPMVGISPKHSCARRRYSDAVLLAKFVPRALRHTTRF
jgi:hypothetical protein